MPKIPATSVKIKRNTGHFLNLMFSIFSNTLSILFKIQVSEKNLLQQFPDFFSIVSNYWHDRYIYLRKFLDFWLQFMVHKTKSFNEMFVLWRMDVLTEENLA